PVPVARVERAAPEPQSSGLPAPQETQTHFPREDLEANVKPDPQELAASRDRMRARLQSLQNDAPDRRTQVLAVAPPKVTKRPTPSGLPNDVDTRPDREQLARADPRPPSPARLARSDPSSSSPAPAPARIRQKAAPPQPAAPAVVAAAPSRQILSGVTLAGPVADRSLISYTPPVYPEWAKEQAIEGSVRLYFEVLPDGAVKENVLVQKTSGVEEFDRNAARALLAWLFEPLSGGAVGEQWGSITLNYRLGDAPRTNESRSGS
ncbi:MAG TPA: energy transducer TonB, partial [bacterium]|nr:energy transducer TonB [bacterium]